MLRFILNDKLIETDLPSGSTVLDFVRYHKRLTGTKIGCREGDCGACTILVGEIETDAKGNDKLLYRSMTSCLMPLGNAANKHIVTVEGVNEKQLSPVQQAMVEMNGTQCGFCTIGFVMSLTGFILEEKYTQYPDAIAAIDGNICRCTGYKSIERAADLLAQKMKNKPAVNHLQWLVKNGFIPAYFLQITERLKELTNKPSSYPSLQNNDMIVGGGTDLVVQKHTDVKNASIHHVFDSPKLKGIIIKNDECHIGASVTVTAFAQSELIQDLFPGLHKYIKLISSSPIRNMATLAGNLANASPIGDMSVFFLALDASVILSNGNNSRTVKLKDFYKAYKQTTKSPDELIETIFFTIPGKNTVFNFEKVSKRTHLDIASVNSGCLLQMNDDGTIKLIYLSAGGVAPYPKYLTKTTSFLTGKNITASVLNEAIDIIYTEIAPISDARGSATYKQLLLRQLFLAHFENREEIIKQVLNH